MNESSEVSLQAVAGGGSARVARRHLRRAGGAKVGPVGDFVPRNHPASGMAAIVINPDGTRSLRIENLDTDNGPDLRVSLSPASVDDRSYQEFFELGRLKGNKGSQNYDIPQDIDLSRVRSVVIWCERFRSAFDEAPVCAPA